MADLDLARHAVGFVVPERPRARALGSGTLISLGRLKGILTAAHVWDEVKNVSEIGLLAFPVRPDQAQRLRVQTEHLEAIKIANQSYSERGPDMAFLKLPVEIASNLEVNSSFVSFERQLSNAFCDPPPDTQALDGVVGIIAEWSDKEPVAMGSLDVTTIRGLLNVGAAVEIEPADGCDRLRFDVLPADDFTLPESYGGTSGGGVWRAFTQMRADQKKYLVQLRLLGVAFYQSDATNGSRSIICHGPKTIYDRMFTAIRARWGAG
jgi:hypothetical protein